MEKEFFVYILTNDRHTVLYTGVTSNLVQRISHRRTKTIRGFTARYNVGKLVYFERHDHPDAAIAREKPLKAGSRARKIALITTANPKWQDLYCDLLPEIASALRASQ